MKFSFGTNGSLHLFGHGTQVMLQAQESLGMLLSSPEDATWGWSDTSCCNLTKKWVQLGQYQHSTTIVTWGQKPCVQGPGLCHPPMDVTFRAQLGRAGDKIKPLSPKIKLSLNLTASPQGPSVPHAVSLAFCFPFCPDDKVRMPKPLVQPSSGVWVSFSSLPQ